MTKKIRNPALLSILLFMALVVQSHARDYYVEVIIFERPSSSEPDSEIWDFSPENLKEKLEDFASFSAKASNFQYSNQLQNLAAVETSLRESRLKILRKASWVQPSAVYQHAPLVSLGLKNSTLPDAFVRVYKTSLILWILTFN